MVAVFAAAALVEEPVQEVAAQLGQSLGSDRVAGAVGSVLWRLAGRHSVVGVCDLSGKVFDSKRLLVQNQFN